MALADRFQGDRYQVRPGDTASRIAARLTGGRPDSFAELRAANADRNWDFLRVGEVLTLPAGWSRPVPVFAPARIGDATSTALEDARARTPWLDRQFFPKLARIADKYGIPRSDLLGVMYQESGVHPYANPNKSSGANGLIHWMPGTPPNTSPEALRALTATDQLDYVDRWIAPWARKLGKPFGSAGMVYAIVFAPARLTPSANESTLIFGKTTECNAQTNRTNPYCANISLDPAGKGAILMSDLTETIRRRTREASFQKFALRLQAEAAGDPNPPASLPDDGGGVASSSSSVGTSSSARGYAVVASLFAVGAGAVAWTLRDWRA